MHNHAAVTASNRPKLTHFSLTTNCVTTLQDIPYSGKVMMIVSMSYLVIQIPSSNFHQDVDGGMQRERPYELATLGLTLACFIGYCLSSVLSAGATDMDRRK